jgi:biotin carboxyl carrier protein
VQLHRLGDSPRYVLSLDDRLVEVLVEEEPRGFHVQIGGAAYQVETVRGGRRGRAEQADAFVDGRWTLRAPLTGVVSEVRFAAGDTVVPGDVLMVVEAMKMLNDLRCRVEGTVTQVNVEQGQRVEIGEALLEISETVS